MRIRSTLFGPFAGLTLCVFLLSTLSCTKLDLKKETAVKTDAVVLNSNNTVTVNGTLIDIGEGGITDHGHCFDKAPEPTPADNFNSLGPVSQTGTFQSTLSLGSGTWYIRSYVAIGPTYYFGDDLVITVSGFPCGTTLTDERDGKLYSTVLIGTQCWMAENLNYGTLINSNSPADDQTDNSIAEKYCYGDDNSVCNVDGGLYQWNEMKDYSQVAGGPGICPDGWHVPTDGEWQSMEIAIGMPLAIAEGMDWRGVDEGTIIKESGTSGFEAKGTGYRKADGSFYGDPEYSYYWTSTDNGTQAWVRGVKDSEERIYRNTINKSYGLCVRCLKD